VWTFVAVSSCASLIWTQSNGGGGRRGQSFLTCTSSTGSCPHVSSAMKRRSQRLANQIGVDIDTENDAANDDPTDLGVGQAEATTPGASLDDQLVNGVSKRSRQSKATKATEKVSVRAAGKKNEKAKPTTKMDSIPSNDSPLAVPSACHAVGTLPRTIELSIRRDDSLSIHHVLGIDEAGRGPLAGPVVAAAVCLPNDENVRLVDGVVDSKLIGLESSRESLYDQIIATPGIAWAVAIVDAPTIDAMNILQATLWGMTLAVSAVMGVPIDVDIVPSANTSVTAGCYVVVGGMSPLPSCITSTATSLDSNHADDERLKSSSVYALVDGNRLPPNLPCQGRAVIKGDGREYCIAAASILAKVTRDRLLHAYDALYPQYGLAQHKGYPTVAHRQAVLQYGASPIHRRTFAPLKHMRLDPVTGNVLPDNGQGTNESS
jgi:ribonuclease HII